MLLGRRLVGVVLHDTCLHRLLLSRCGITHARSSESGAEDGRLAVSGGGFLVSCDCPRSGAQVEEHCQHAA